MDLFIILNIITSIAILFIVAIGLAVVFGLMGVINLAHGEFIMIGAFITFFTISLGLSPWLAFITAPFVVAIVGLITERLLMRHLYGKIMETILATWGLGIVLRQVIELVFGKGYKSVPMPIESSMNVFGVQYPTYRLLIIAIAIAFILGLYLLETKTSFGITVRAVIQNPDLASSVGVNINKVYSTSFVLGSALAGFAGAVVAPLVGVSPNMGIDFVIDAFLTVLVGGMGSLFGLAGSATLLGTSESLVSYLFDPVWGSMSMVILTIIVMRFRKQSI